MTAGVLGRRIRVLRRYRYLYLMAVPVLLFYALFHYSPMYGLIIAFKDYNVFKGILGSPWAGLYNFELVFGDDYFWKVVRNTAIISLLKLGFGFPAPIIIALLLNEVLHMGFKRVIQTVIYLPRFISWVILAGIMINILSIHGGLVNQIVELFGGTPAVVPVEARLLPPHRHHVAHLEDAGWGSIIYLAALAGINVELYESAVIDGVDIDYISVPAPAQRGHHERLNLLIASGDIPDLFSSHPPVAGLGGSIYRNLSSNQQLVNIRETVAQDKGRWPNIWARTDFPSVHAFETATGELNAIAVKNDVWNHGFVIREDWLDKLGLEVPQTIDELRDVLRAFVAEDPDGTGNFGLTTVNSWWLQHLVTGFTGAFDYYDTGDKFIHTIYQPEWLEGMRYVNSWFDEGLIDPEIFVHQPYRDELSKFTSGKAGVLLGHSSWVYLEKDMRELFSDVRLTAMPPDAMGRNSVARYSGPPWWEAVSIYRHTPDPARVLDIVEFIMEEQDTLFVRRHRGRPLHPGERQEGQERGAAGARGMGARRPAGQPRLVPGNLLHPRGAGPREGDRGRAAPRAGRLHRQLGPGAEGRLRQRPGGDQPGLRPHPAGHGRGRLQAQRHILEVLQRLPGRDRAQRRELGTDEEGILGRRIRQAGKGTEPEVLPLAGLWGWLPVRPPRSFKHRLRRIHRRLPAAVLRDTSSKPFPSLSPQPCRDGVTGLCWPDDGLPASLTGCPLQRGRRGSH